MNGVWICLVFVCVWTGCSRASRPDVDGTDSATDDAASDVETDDTDPGTETAQDSDSGSRDTEDPERSSDSEPPDTGDSEGDADSEPPDTGDTAFGTDSGSGDTEDSDTAEIGDSDDEVPYTYQWHSFYGATEFGWGPLDQWDDLAFDAALSSSGDLVVVGNTVTTWNGPNGELPLRDEGRDFFLRLGADGAYKFHSFEALYHGRGDACAVSVDREDNIYIAGSGGDPSWSDAAGPSPLNREGDFAVFKYDVAGTYLWHTLYGTPNDTVADVATADGGDLYIVGTSDASWTGPDEAPPRYPFVGEAGNPNLFALKLDGSGTYQWHAFFAGSCDPPVYGCSLAGRGVFSASGNLYVYGSVKQLWDGPSGESPLYRPDETTAVVVVKLGPDGSYQWHTFYPGSAAAGIAVDADENLYLAARSRTIWAGPNGESPVNATLEEVDTAAVVKLDKDGEYLWHGFWGQAYRARDIALGKGGVVVAGLSEEEWNGPNGEPPVHSPTGLLGAYSDIVLLKLDPNGGYRWHTRFGNNRIRSRCTLVSDSGGNLYVTAESHGEWLGEDESPPLHAYADYDDIVVLKIAE